MSRVTDDLLESYLTEYGWTFQPLGQGSWHTGFQGDQRLYPLSIRRTATCVSFEIRPFVPGKLDLGCWPGLARELLELNHRMQLVKLGINESGELVLGCQVLSLGLDFEAFANILGILAYYADELAPELQFKVETLTRTAPSSLLS